jgi:hypothetical protein
VAQLFSLGIKIGLRLELAGLAGKISVVRFEMSKISAVRFGLARAWRCELTGRSFPIGGRSDWPGFIMIFTSLMPNKSPEPTGVGAGCSAIAVHVAGRRWLSFFR